MDDDYYSADASSSQGATPAPVAIDRRYYSADDDWRTYANDYYSVKGTTSWLDKFFSNSTNNLELNPAQDVNPDNVLASLLFNSLVCVILLVVYELLRRWIPSVYAQATSGPNKVVYLHSTTENSSKKTSNDGKVADEIDNIPGSVAGENPEYSASCDDIHQKVCSHVINPQNSCAFPILEWCIPVHKTPWSTFRHVAGLDAYFYLRYIRMCLKITVVSSFWAIVILCPVYATGGGYQSGFYYFSMANVLPQDAMRVWVPSVFCWAFTMYCWFCVRAEMIHYVDLRMEFLGGEEEELIQRRMREASIGREYDEPQNFNHVQDESKMDMRRSRSRGEKLAVVCAEGRNTGKINMPQQSEHQMQIREMKQHRYSLQVEKVPVELRSNTALFNYFNEIFPGQVHSACMAMNVPDLDALSARRMRVCRRLEKSLAYHSVTGIRPTHIAGRPRFYCCGIESTPVDGWCLIYDCFHDDAHPYLDKNDPNYPTEVYDDLPGKGECVDSILYYTRDLANCNLKMKKLQAEKFRIAETGISPRHGGDGLVVDESNCDWYTPPLAMLKTSAAMAVGGLRDEFEVSGEEDYFGDGVVGGRNGMEYGSITDSSALTSRQRSQEKTATLVDEYQLTDFDGHPTDHHSFENGDENATPSSRQRIQYSIRPHIGLRALLWRMGVDCLATSLEEIRDRTDVVVDSVTRPSMSSTGFVTFKTLTPVTVTTSTPLTYNRNPMKVSIAPETRDIVWQNVQIDRDISAGRAFVANVLLGLGVLLWSIPLTLIQAWAKVENVALIPGLEWVGQIHGGRLKPLINGYLPVITLLGLILLLPLIFNWVATSYEKRKTLSGVQNSIVGRYFYYQLANIYITVTAGALWTSLAEIIDHPQQLLVILGQTLPKLAGYFISLLLTKTLAGLPMVLLRMGALSRMIFLRSCFNKKRLTQRELNEVYRKQPIYYGWEYPTQFLVIIICFTYACISPLVLPVGSAYFFVALLVYKKQALYVYSPTYESGGKMFPQAVNKTLFALVISQLTFIGFTLIRKGVFQIILLAPLPFLTVFFMLYIQSRYVEPSKKLSLERAVKIDSLLVHPYEFSHETYQQPVLSEPASVPMCDTNDKALSEVLENLVRLQNQTRDAPQDRPPGLV